MPVGSDKCLSLNKLNNSFNWFIEKKLNHSRRIQATVFISESFNHSFNQFIQNTDSFWDKIPLLFMMQWVYYSFVSNYCCWWSKNILSKAFSHLAWFEHLFLNLANFSLGSIHFGIYEHSNHTRIQTKIGPRLPEWGSLSPIETLTLEWLLVVRKQSDPMDQWTKLYYNS